MKKRILFIDDDPGIRGSIQKVLEGADYEVLVSENPDAAAPIPVDLALLDLNLSLEERWDLLEKLTQEYSGVPIIILTPFSDQGETPTEVGAVMEKPPAPDALLKTIEELLSEGREERLNRLRRGAEPRFIPSSNTQLLRKLRERAMTPLPFRPGYAGSDLLCQP